MIALTAKKLHLLVHAIGWDRTTPKKRSKIHLPEHTWRNRYSADIGHHSYGDLMELVAMGLMEHHKPDAFYVTAKGIACVKEFLP